ncbi:putative 5-amino-6-(5-phosphoribosylamino)uracil reductase [Helianthus annuus]|nr:putative 5-amino-6-(5-phosphoribosylamino)uracil reductase [Helianthus annuus]
MEPGDCHGDYTAVSALIKAGISRVVIGMRYPLQHLRGKAIHTLRSEGLQVDVLGEDIGSGSIKSRLSPFAITIGQKEEEEIKRDPLTELRSVWGLKGG